MNNELELRLECMKLAVEITPTLNIPIQEKVLGNFDFILNKVTDNGNITFESIKAKNTEDIISNIIGLASMAEDLIVKFKKEESIEDELPVPIKDKSEEKQPKKKAKEDIV